MMKRLAPLVLFSALPVFAAKVSLDMPRPRVVVVLPEEVVPPELPQGQNFPSGAGLPIGCTSPGTGAITCTNTITAGSFATSGTGAAYTQWTTGALPVSGAGTVLCGANTGNLFSCSDNAGPVTAIPFLAGDIGGTQASPQTVGLHLTAEGYTGNQALTFTCANDTVTGPTNNLLALQTSTGCIKATTGNTNVPLTITFSGGATSGSSHQVYSGIGSCIMDATTASTQGFYVIASVLVAGRCHAQSAQPTGVYIIGVMNDNATTIAVAGNVLVGGPYALPSALSGLTTGFIPKAASATSLSNSLCDEAISNAATLTCTDVTGIYATHDLIAAGNLYIGSSPALTNAVALIDGNARVGLRPGGGILFVSSNNVITGTCDLSLTRVSPNVFGIGGTTCASGDVTGKLQSGAYLTGTNCSSSASPAVCGSAAAGSVAVPTGVTPTLVVNTTAVTANSQILFTPDESLGTKLSVTCNSTIAQVAIEPIVTARTAATSFTIQYNTTITTNPICLSYFIIN